VHAPSTTVMPRGKTLVRLDVRELVLKWQKHEKADNGIAVLADTSSPTGTAFALTVAEEGSASERSVVDPPGGAQDPVRTGIPRAGPRLELYVK